MLFLPRIAGLLARRTPALALKSTVTLRATFFTQAPLWLPAAASKSKAVTTKAPAKKAAATTRSTKRKSTTVKKPATKAAAKKPVKAKVTKKKAATKKPKIEKYPPPPKRPLSPFFLFVQERRTPVHTYDANLAITKASSEAWRSMSDAEKKPYHDRSATARETFPATLAKWQASLTPEQLRDYTKKARARRVRLFGVVDPVTQTPLKRPPSSYSLFLSEVIGDVAEEERKKGNATLVTAVTPIVAQRWKALGAAGQEPYRLRATGMRDEYIKIKDKAVTAAKDLRKAKNPTLFR